MLVFVAPMSVDEPEDSVPLDNTTQRWLREAKDGDAAHFNRLYEHVAPAVHAWAELRIRRDGRTELDAQDVVQEVWFRTWRALEKFDDESVPFRKWVFRVAKVVLLELLRDGRRRRQLDLGSDVKRAVFDEIVDAATAVSGRVARNDSIATFVRFVASLPQDEQRLLLTCGLEGLNYEEASRRLDSTPGAVARRWQRLRNRLSENGLPTDLIVELE